MCLVHWEVQIHLSGKHTAWLPAFKFQKSHKSKLPQMWPASLVDLNFMDYIVTRAFSLPLIASLDKDRRRNLLCRRSVLVIGLLTNRLRYDLREVSFLAGA